MAHSENSHVIHVFVFDERNFGWLNSKACNFLRQFSLEDMTSNLSLDDEKKPSSNGDPDSSLKYHNQFPESTDSLCSLDSTSHTASHTDTVHNINNRRSHQTHLTDLTAQKQDPCKNHCLKAGYLRIRFLLDAVNNLRANLRARGQELIITAGKPEVELIKLCTIYYNNYPGVWPF